MTEPDVLRRKIRELTNWQTAAWRRLAEPLLTSIERREIRNHMMESHAELHRCLGMMSDRLRFRDSGESAGIVGDSRASIKFRLLA